MPDGGHQTPHRFDREGEIQRCIRSLSRALELHDGSPIATMGALTEVELVKWRLPQIEASLRDRYDAIKDAPR